VDDRGIATGVPMADSSRRRRWPGLVGARNEALTVVWESLDPRRDSVQGAVGTPIGVDVASFDGQGWSPVQTIIQARSIGLTAPPAVRAGTTFNPAVVAAVARDSGPAFVRMSRYSGGSWSVIDWRGDFDPSYVVALPARDESIVLALSGSPRASIATGVYAVRGDGAGASIRWSPPELIDSIRGNYSAFTSARLGGDTLVLVWHDSEQQAMKTAVSIDGGRGWRRLAPVPLSSGMDGERLVVDAAGGLHVIYRGASDETVLNAPGGIRHSRWIGGTWTRPVTVSPGESMTAPGAGAAPGGRVMATWTEALFAPYPMPKSFASFWTPGCPTR
jgi:hypothetical protein